MFDLLKYTNYLKYLKPALFVLGAILLLNVLSYWKVLVLGVIVYSVYKAYTFFKK